MSEATTTTAAAAPPSELEGKLATLNRTNKKLLAERDAALAELSKLREQAKQPPANGAADESLKQALETATKRIGDLETSARKERLRARFVESASKFKPQPGALDALFERLSPQLDSLEWENVTADDFDGLLKERREREPFFFQADESPPPPPPNGAGQRSVKGQGAPKYTMAEYRKHFSQPREKRDAKLDAEFDLALDEGRITDS